MQRDSSRSVDRPNSRKGRVPSIVLAGRQLANFNPVSARARSTADQFLNAPTIIAAVDGKGMTRLTGIVSTTRALDL